MKRRENSISIIKWHRRRRNEEEKISSRESNGM